MKKFLFLIISVILYADVSGIIQKIKEIDSYKPEFHKFINYNIFTKPHINNSGSVKISSKSSPLILEAIFNNKAYINNSWVKKGDVIYGYRVEEVKNSFVVLKKFNKKYILEFKNNLLKVKK